VSCVVCCVLFVCELCVLFGLSDFVCFWNGICVVRCVKCRVWV